MFLIIYFQQQHTKGAVRGYSREATLHIKGTRLRISVQGNRLRNQKKRIGLPIIVEYPSAVRSFLKSLTFSWGRFKRGVPRGGASKTSCYSRETHEFRACRETVQGRGGSFVSCSRDGTENWDSPPPPLNNTQPHFETCAREETDKAGWAPRSIITWWDLGLPLFLVAVNLQKWTPVKSSPEWGWGSSLENLRLFFCLDVATCWGASRESIHLLLSHSLSQCCLCLGQALGLNFLWVFLSSDIFERSTSIDRTQGFWSFCRWGTDWSRRSYGRKKSQNSSSTLRGLAASEKVKTRLRLPLIASFMTGWAKVQTRLQVSFSAPVLNGCYVLNSGSVLF